MGPRAGLDRFGKSRPPPGFDTRTVQPVASRYTDYATRPTESHRNGYKIFVIPYNFNIIQRFLFLKKSKQHDTLSLTQIYVHRKSYIFRIK